MDQWVESRTAGILRRSGQGLAPGPTHNPGRTIMSGKSSTPSRRNVLAASAAAGAAGLFAAGPAIAADETNAGTAIVPFLVHAPEAKLADLRRRISATQWPERETVTDATQGVQFATMQKLAPLLGQRLRLAQSRGADQRAAEFHDRNRRAGHSFHPRPLETRECAYRSSSRTGGRARSSSSSRSSAADRPDGARRQRIGTRSIW